MITWVRGIWPTGYGELDSCGRTLNDKKFFNQSCKFQLPTFSCLPREILENVAYIYHTYHCITCLPLQVSHVLAVYFSNGSQTRQQISSNSRSSIQGNIPKPIQGAGRVENTPPNSRVETQWNHSLHTAVLFSLVQICINSFVRRHSLTRTSASCT